MTSEAAYAKNLENKLINEFKIKFYEKMGYHPIVLTKTSILNQEIPMVSLEDLEECFSPFLPVRRGLKLTIKSTCRVRELVDLRKIFCALARSMRYSLKTVGSYLGGQDHTTVIHNVQVFNNLVETNEGFRNLYFEILKKLKDKHGTPAMDYFNQTQYNS